MSFYKEISTLYISLSPFFGNYVQLSIVLQTFRGVVRGGLHLGRLEGTGLQFYFFA